MKTRIKVEVEPWMFGHFTQAAATLDCSVDESVLKFLNSDEGGDALCEWINNLKPESEIAGNPSN